MFDLSYNISDMIWFLLILVRVATIIFVMPVFGAKFLPSQWKIGFAVILAVLLSMVIHPLEQNARLATAGGLMLGVGSEVMIGLVLGLTTGFIFYSVMLWGQLIGAQMGLGLANIVDPTAGGDISVVSQFYYMFAIVIFLSIDGHHMLINGMLDSYDYFPAGAMTFPFKSLRSFIELSGSIFTVAVQLAASMIVLLLLVSTILGVIARTVPQMNIFIVGFPLKLFVGLLGLVLSVPYITKALIDLFRRIPVDLAAVLGS
ncbi:MAG: flagellar biosynthetic protein FliR [Bacteroidales bacterium]|nr:flagellar biosynthetic protein FliR [Candidatus Latescibacterota bacterium]